MNNNQDEHRFFTEVLQIKTMKWLQDNACTNHSILLQNLPFIDVARNKVTHHKADIALIDGDKLHSYHVVPDQADGVGDQLLETLELASKVFDSTTVVITDINRPNALILIADNFGVICINESGEVKEARKPSQNNNDTKAIANLLTKSDLLKVYGDKGLKGITGHAKPILLEFAADYLTTDEAKQAAIASLTARHKE